MLIETFENVNLEPLYRISICNLQSATDMRTFMKRERRGSILNYLLVLSVRKKMNELLIIKMNMISLIRSQQLTSYLPINNISTKKKCGKYYLLIINTMISLILTVFEQFLRNMNLNLGLQSCLVEMQIFNFQYFDSS